MSAELKSNTAFTGSVHKIYDEVWGPVYFEPYAIDTADRVSRLNPSSVLETACGTGIVTLHLRNKIKGSITATDINPDMLAIAKSKLHDKEISWQVADAMDLPFANAQFDCIVTQFGVMFFSDKVSGMKEAYRLLKPGGTFIFLVWGALEANGISATGRKIIGEFFDNQPPAFYNIAYSMNNIDEVNSIIKEGGFTHFSHEVLTKECSCESARIMAEGLVEGNQIVHAIRERDENALGILKEKVFSSLVKRFGDHPCKSTMEAIVFTATK
jgi:ubiquinone/menaquinone biosynthesis C-methylase UbiE